MNLSKGDEVVNSRMLQWGTGKVIDIISPDKVRIRFSKADPKEKIISIRHAELRKVPDQGIKEYVIYHNAVKKGYRLPCKGKKTEWDTIKGRSKMRGCKVWMIEGDGEPRRHYLCGSFYVKKVSKTTVVGEPVRWLPKKVCLNGKAWFKEFRQKQGSFAFGLQTISDFRFIKKLEQLTKHK